MKLVKTASGDKLSISHREWKGIGRQAGWQGGTDPKKAVDVLKSLFPQIQGVMLGEEWGAGPGSLHLGNAAEGGSIEGVPAAEYNSTEIDPEEKVYVMGVHKKLSDVLDKLGYYAEWHDAGTLLAYPA